MPSDKTLYVATVLTWGSTWYVITFQLGTTPPEVSVAYRFLVAGAILVGFAALTGKSLRFTLRQHARMALLGLMLFGLNYVLVYYASGMIPSGLVAVVFSTITMANIINATVFLKRRSSLGVWLGAAGGLAGIALVFLPDLSSAELGQTSLAGLGLTLCSVMLASLGNTLMTAFRNEQLPVVQSTGFSMVYGGTATLLYSALAGLSFAIEPTAIYLGSLAFLVLIGSVAAFLCYLTLLGRIGPEKASYAVVLTPVVALVFSTLFEGFVWSLPAIAGVAIILLGNVVILKSAAGPQAPAVTPVR